MGYKGTLPASDIQISSLADWAKWVTHKMSHNPALLLAGLEVVTFSCPQGTSFLLARGKEKAVEREKKN